MHKNYNLKTKYYMLVSRFYALCENLDKSNFTNLDKEWLFKFLDDTKNALEDKNYEVNNVTI